MKADELNNIALIIHEIKIWAKQNLIGNDYPSPIGAVNITMKGIKETINQPHKLRNEKNNAIYQLPELLFQSKYVDSAVDDKGNLKEYHYLEIEIGNEISYLVIRENWQGVKHFYSIVDKIKEKKNG